MRQEPETLAPPGDRLQWQERAVLRAWGRLMSGLCWLGDVALLMTRPELLGAHLRLSWVRIVRSPYHWPRSFETVRRLQRAGQSRRELTYGETPAFTTAWLLRRAGVGPESRVIDLAAGRGRALLGARRLGARAWGIEIAGEHVQATAEILSRVGIRLHHGDGADVDLQEASHIYVAWSHFASATIARFVARFETTAKGTRFITVGQAIEHQDFVLLSQHNVLFTWGTAQVFIYEHDANRKAGVRSAVLAG